MRAIQLRHQLIAPHSRKQCPRITNSLLHTHESKLSLHQLIELHPRKQWIMITSAILFIWDSNKLFAYFGHLRDDFQQKKGAFVISDMASNKKRSP